eukprot:9871036-Lingulodinium_polyedra.AAC.1
MRLGARGSSQATAAPQGTRAARAPWRSLRRSWQPMGHCCIATRPGFDDANRWRELLRDAAQWPTAWQQRERAPCGGLRQTSRGPCRRPRW